MAKSCKITVKNNINLHGAVLAAQVGSIDCQSLTYQDLKNIVINKGFAIGTNRANIILGNLACRRDKNIDLVRTTITSNFEVKLIQQDGSYKKATLSCNRDLNFVYQNIKDKKFNIKLELPVVNPIDNKPIDNKFINESEITKMIIIDKAGNKYKLDLVSQIKQDNYQQSKITKLKPEQEEFGKENKESKEEIVKTKPEQLSESQTKMVAHNNQDNQIMQNLKLSDRITKKIVGAMHYVIVNSHVMRDKVSLGVHALTRKIKSIMTPVPYDPEKRKEELNELKKSTEAIKSAVNLIAINNNPGLWALIKLMDRKKSDDDVSNFIKSKEQVEQITDMFLKYTRPSVFIISKVIDNCEFNYYFITKRKFMSENGNIYKGISFDAGAGYNSGQVQLLDNKYAGVNANVGFCEGKAYGYAGTTENGKLSTVGVGFEAIPIGLHSHFELREMCSKYNCYKISYDYSARYGASGGVSMTVDRDNIWSSNFNFTGKIAWMFNSDLIIERIPRNHKGDKKNEDQAITATINLQDGEIAVEESNIDKKPKP